jgi:hypothetical protein
VRLSEKGEDFLDTTQRGTDEIGNSASLETPGKEAVQKTLSYELVVMTFATL